MSNNYPTLSIERTMADGKLAIRILLDDDGGTTFQVVNGATGRRWQHTYTGSTDESIAAQAASDIRAAAQDLLAGPDNASGSAERALRAALQPTIQSRGGHARAKSMSKRARSASASKAARARWSK